MKSSDHFTPGWPENFPKVTQLTNMARMENHADYKAAKNGDWAAAARLVPALLNDKAYQAKLRVLSDRHPNAILVAVHALERGGENFIPRALADYISSVTGLDVNDDIVQSAKVGRTGQGGWFRLAFRPKFDGAVQSGREYILVDDAVTDGGTFGELRRYIEHQGGHVVDTVAIGTAKFRQQIALTAKTKLALEQKYDVQSLQEFLQEHELYDGNHTALTESEARLLLGAGSLDAARNRVLAAINEERQRVLQKNIQEPAQTFLTKTADNEPTKTKSTTAQSIVAAIVKRSIQNAKNFSPAQSQTKSAVK